MGTPALVRARRPLGEAEQCVSAHTKFGYTFSQRHNTGSLYSRGHHLAPGGNTRQGPDDLLAPPGERLPRRACWSQIEAGSGTVWEDGQVTASKNIFPFQSTTFTQMLPSV